MGQQVGVSKAAKTLGVTRAELNDRLQAAGIETFEGQVDFEKVKCIAPQLDFGDKNLERLEHIRENPAWRINGGDVKATPKEMADEIRRLSTELMAEVETSASYRRIIEEFAEKLGHLQVSVEGERRDMAFELCQWLRAEIVKP
ncbi:MAG: hypothetical protein HOK06_01380 [Rhodospirillaceae bacterium]|jgi:CDP-4-dehydro-6-deoxyglucose reductase, E3|nr:hypothetical protein [Rhodospirillaceae bacterium]MBT4219189.1 hypothetical protein [Rhodospirillaceae bacterium]MBT5013097.1 hypothetical protein [Rhodospirillaceae bacterium]MBT6406230.1 hypothetical protein [Rhodospirillaceae bacterium]MBT7357163.1 hypothetical protein [Rhodospirillaceae bacterium]